MSRSAKQITALRVLAEGDAYMEGGTTTLDHGRIVNVSTARALIDAGLAEWYETGSRPPFMRDMVRITDAGRAALAERQS